MSIENKGFQFETIGEAYTRNPRMNEVVRMQKNQEQENLKHENDIQVEDKPGDMLYGTRVIFEVTEDLRRRVTNPTEII